MSKSVVNIYCRDEGVAEIAMEYNEQKNQMDKNLVIGLSDAFSQVNACEDYKVILLRGYETIFCSGGSKEGLLDIQANKLNFADLNIHSLLLDSKIPVVAAMQGHAIGAGLTMGLFADFIVLARESIYKANYMNFGFTPGMGATYIIPKKLGIVLGNEMLMSGAGYAGGELAARGATLKVYPRKEVMDQARALARLVAEKPRHALILLKDNLVSVMRKELLESIEKELIMHDKTMHTELVKQRINTLID